MSVPSTNRATFAAAVLSMLLCMRASGSVRAFLDASGSWLPTDPVIIAREATGRWAGTTYAGYDPGTGAWFMASGERAGGRDPDGLSWLMVTGKGQPSTPVYEPLPYHIGTLMPVAILASMHERPEIVSQAVRRDGSWFVTYRVTLDRTQSPEATADFVAEFDALTGRMLSHERHDAEDPQRIEFDHADPRIEQARQTGDGPGYRVSFEPEVSTTSFDRTAVIHRMQAAAIATQQRLSAISAGYTEDQDGVWSRPSEAEATVPYAGGSVSRFRMPLLVGGVLLLLVVGVEVFRARDSA